MLYRLSELVHTWGPFRLFEYISVRAIMAGVTALLLGMFFSGRLIAVLARLRQPERSAKLMGELAKEGGKVPTMGGLIIAIAMIPSVLLWARLNVLVLAALWCLIGMGLVGLYDDWLKVRHGSSDGISARMKLAGQGLVALIAFGIVLLDPAYRESLCEIWLPVLNGPLWSAKSLGWPFLACLGVAGVFFVLVCVGCSNAVNLTDGLDGLAIMPVVMVGSALGVFAYVTGSSIFSRYLLLPYIPGAGELLIFCAAMAGAGLAFLWFNTHPAQVFMGDVGALALGGALGTIAVIVRQEIVLAIMGGIFVAEAISVMVQVSYFKYTKKKYGEGRRILKMAPLHHHFEKSGWKETQVVVRFWIITMLLCLVGLSTLKLR